MLAKIWLMWMIIITLYVTILTSYHIGKDQGMEERAYEAMRDELNFQQKDWTFKVM